MTPAEIRRLSRAARQLDTLPARTATLQARYQHAETVLRAALERTDPGCDHPIMPLPGYLVTLTDGRPTVARSAIANAAQLALWRAMQDGAA